MDLPYTLIRHLNELRESHRKVENTRLRKIFLDDKCDYLILQH
jgi:hypothetical protein